MTNAYIPSLQEIEEIAYQTALLLQRGWKRIYCSAHPEYEQFKREPGWYRLPSFAWVKTGFKHDTCFSGERCEYHYMHHFMQTPFFDLQSAYEAEMKANIIYEDR